MIDERVVHVETLRGGFFRGPVFLHPDLKFQYEFPDGWNTWHGGDAVVGLNSAQDAIIKLAVAPGIPPEAAQAFLSQPGFEVVGTVRNRINGFHATTGEFIAENGQGTVRGIATFIECGGATFQVTASTISDEFARYSSVFQRSITTFDRLTDPGALDAPVRLTRTKARRAAIPPSNSASELSLDPIVGSIPENPRLRQLS